MKKSLLLLLALGGTTLFQGCDNGSHGDKSAAPAAPAQKKLRLAFVSASSGDFWSILRLGCDTAARKLGDVDLDFRAPLEHTAAAQQEILASLVASGVDGIAISPIDADQLTGYFNSIATNTLLVCANSDAAKSKRVCYIGPNNVAAGVQAAELLKAALPQGGKIMLFVGYTNAQNAQDRIEGIKTGLTGTTFEIVGTMVDNAQSPLALKNAQDALANHPDLAGMVGIYGYNGPAILTAVRGAGKAGQVKIVCFDENSETLAGIAAGDIYGTICSSPFSIGRDTIHGMGQYLRGDRSQLATGKIIIPTQVVTQDRVAGFQAQLKIGVEYGRQL